MMKLIAVVTMMMASGFGCVTTGDGVNRADGTTVRSVDPVDVVDGTCGFVSDGVYHLGNPEDAGCGGGLSITVHPEQAVVGIEFDVEVYGGDLYTYGYTYDFSTSPNITRNVGLPVYSNSGHVAMAFDRSPNVIVIVPHNVTGMTYRGGVISNITVF